MHHRLLRVAVLAALGIALMTASAAPVAQSGNGEPGLATVRFATFNASLNRNNAGELRADLLASTDLSRPGVVQAHNVAEIIQRIAPDVVLINEFDFDPMALDLFADRFLAVPHGDAAGIQYPFRFIAPSNTGIQSGFDLDNNGVVGGPNDAFGFGFFPGQFGMAVYSRYPIDRSGVRTFQLFRWKDMPGARLPDDPRTPTSGRLVLAGGAERLPPLVQEPLGPADPDRPQDRALPHEPSDAARLRRPADVPRRGRLQRATQRRRDPLLGRLHHARPDERVHLRRCRRTGRLTPGSLFVIAGDQNSDPLDGDSIPGAIQQLLEHPLVNTELTPSSPGAPEAAVLQGGANATHRTPALFDTADFADGAPGNLRADYVLPRVNMDMRDAARLLAAEDR